MSRDSLLDFIAELGMLKRVKRSGWGMLGMPIEESVAEHSFRCAAIGYFLAKMEKADAYKVLLMTLFNDSHESRITDLHKVAHKYLDVKKGERDAFAEQISDLPRDTKKELGETRKELDTQKTKESIIARDADILECLLQAKEYADLGFKQAEKFFKIGPKHLKTKSSKMLWKKSATWNSASWWENLSKFDR